MIEIAIVAGLILLNGVFAMSELAIVSSRKSRLKSMAESRRAGAAAALDLAENPGRFLSTVQIGITLIGIGTGAFSGATIGGTFSDFLLDAGLPQSVASPLGYGGVVVVITYLSVVIGELVPKQLALRNAEAIACTVAPLMRFLSIAAAPVVWLLEASTKLIFRLIGQSEVAENIVTEDEIKMLVAEAASSGVIETEERQMITGVLRLSDSTARSVMTPRTDVDWIDLEDTPAAIRAQLIETRHSRLPVAQGHPDNVIGVITVRELGRELPDSAEALRRYIRKVPVIPDTMPALDVLERLRQSEHPIALVHDEYGHFKGVVTPADMLEAIAGVFRSDIDEDEDAESAVKRADGSWLLAGSLSADGLADALGIPMPHPRDFQTAAGFVINRLQHLPQTGEHLDIEGWRIEVVDMDGRRIDKLLAIPVTPEAVSRQ